VSGGHSSLVGRRRDQGVEDEPRRTEVLEAGAAVHERAHRIRVLVAQREAVQLFARVDPAKLTEAERDHVGDGDAVGAPERHEALVKAWLAQQRPAQREPRGRVTRADGVDADDAVAFVKVCEASQKQQEAPLVAPRGLREPFVAERALLRRINEAKVRGFHRDPRASPRPHGDGDVIQRGEHATEVSLVAVNQSPERLDSVRRTDDSILAAVSGVLRPEGVNLKLHVGQYANRAVHDRLVCDRGRVGYFGLCECLAR